MDFPKWAPKELCEIYLSNEKDGWACWGPEVLGPGITKQEIKALMYRLLTEKDMRLVWKLSEEAFSEGVLVCTEEGVAFVPCEVMAPSSVTLWEAVVHSYVTAKWESRKVPEGERVKRLNKIATQANYLAGIVKYSEFDARWPGIFYRKKQGLEGSIRAAESLGEFRKQYGNLPFLHEILQYVAKEAESEAEEPNLRYISKTRSRNAVATAFIRAMSLAIGNNFRKRRNQWLAHLSRVVLEPDLDANTVIDEEFVRKTIDKWKDIGDDLSNCAETPQKIALEVPLGKPAHESDLDLFEA